MFSQESLQHLCKAVATNIAADNRCFMVIENALKELKSNTTFKQEILDQLLKETKPYLPEKAKNERDTITMDSNS